MVTDEGLKKAADSIGYGIGIAGIFVGMGLLFGGAGVSEGLRNIGKYSNQSNNPQHQPAVRETTVHK